MSKGEHKLVEVSVSMFTNLVVKRTDLGIRMFRKLGTILYFLVATATLEHAFAFDLQAAITVMDSVVVEGSKQRKGKASIP